MSIHPFLFKTKNMTSVSANTVIPTSAQFIRYQLKVKALAIIRESYPVCARGRVQSIRMSRARERTCRAQNCRSKAYKVRRQSPTKVPEDLQFPEPVRRNNMAPT